MIPEPFKADDLWHHKTFYSNQQKQKSKSQSCFSTSLTLDTYQSLFENGQNAST